MTHDRPRANPAPPFRLLMLTHYYAAHRGGIELVALSLAQALARQGFTVSWMASDTDPCPAAEPRWLVCRPARAWNRIEHWWGIPFPLWSPGSLLRLWRAVADADVVLLHDSLYFGNVLGFWMARWRRRPVVIVQHIGLVPFPQWPLRRLMAAANRLIALPMLRRADQAVFISDTTLAHFAPRLRRRRPPAVIFNGVDTGTFRPAAETDQPGLRLALGLPATGPVLLFVGRFVAKKGLPVLRRLASALPQAQWVFAGWGPLDPSGWELPNVRVERDRKGATLVPLYQAADLLVLPSVGEGFPLVVQEAMACGTPALCGCDSAFADPEAAPLIEAEAVDPADDAGTAERWARRIAELLAGPAALATRRPTIAAFAQQRWSWDQTGRRYAEVLAVAMLGSGRQSSGHT